MWCKIVSHDFPHRSQTIQRLDPQPKRLDSRFPIAFPSKEPTKAGGHKNPFARGRRVLGRDRIVPDITMQSFPFGFFKGHRRCMRRRKIVHCRPNMKEVSSRRHRKIGPAASNNGEIVTKSQADLTRCPFSLNRHSQEQSGIVVHGHDRDR